MPPVEKTLNLELQVIFCTILQYLDKFDPSMYYEVIGFM